MRWEFEEKIHVEFWFFSGINFAGTKKVVRIHPYGGLQGDVSSGDFKSVGIICEPGLRVTFMTSATGAGWETMPWRCVQVIEGKTNTLTDGRKAVQIPDLDTYAEPDAPRSDPEFEMGFPEVETFAEGKTWTFGKVGRRPLKQNIRSIRVERIPGGPLDLPSEDDDAEESGEKGAGGEKVESAEKDAGGEKVESGEKDASGQKDASTAAPERALVVEDKPEVSATPEPEVKASNASQHLTVRHSEPTTQKKQAKHIPKSTSLSPGSGRKN